MYRKTSLEPKVSLSLRLQKATLLQQNKYCILHIWALADEQVKKLFGSESLSFLLTTGSNCC